MIPAIEALNQLREGNQRYANGIPGMGMKNCQAERMKLVSGQQPRAVILGCSDSRVPAEIIFDQGLGELFVIRIAGNVAATSQIASVEFAVTEFQTRLVVVMGHSHCGAIQATLSSIENGGEAPSPNLGSIINRIRPVIQPLLGGGNTDNSDDLIKRAIRANVCASVDELQHGSRIIEDHVRNEGLMIVGAEYSLETGEVDFFEGVPE